jgi:hypothetical protein
MPVRRFNSDTGTFRNTFRGKRVYVKPHNVVKDNLMLSITPHRAIYEEVNNTISLSRPGYLTFDFVEIQENRADYK